MSSNRTTTSITCADLSFTWPDGTAVLDDLSLVVGPGRTGLVGVNGSGKSTLLRLMAGELAPTSGAVRVSGTLGYLPQDVTLNADQRVEQALGIAPVRAAIRAIEAGNTDEETFAVVGDDWDVDERARAALDRLGLEHVTLERRIGELSGGESVLLCLAAQFIRRPDVLLLDEPTNNLDLDARRRLNEAVASWRGTMVIVSHDRELLDHVDRIADLRDGEVRWYGGGFTDYEAALEAEQEAAARMVRVAESDVRRQKKELADARIKLDRRLRYGKKMYENKREPKVVMGERKRQAQVAAGKHRNMHIERLDEARERLTEAEEAVREDKEIRVDLPETEVPAGRTVLTLRDLRIRHGGRADLDVRGPERIALVGGNGAGKTTLLRTIVGEIPAESGQVMTAVPTRYLPQRLDLLDEELTVAQNVGAFAPGATANTVRARLARFLFRGRRADQPVGTLSGGERFRATLAALLLADPPPQLLLLDEPTNNLDLASVRQLTSALSSYRGALIVVSHDVAFLRELGITRWLRLAAESDGAPVRLTTTDPL
ncbi:ABC-F family ATP-binding cassette domain-containing protein [Streptomyces alkaliterrae]|uniref:ATP-binding cassette domain-containing protein n=1 Tax=Streptomyces alkaliterrae TaxID=2213162 RepID=A0A5P0YRL9_9ACTN|nr:ABC-F family ATP-binding cassette domain-containing protein [Streptomyces alkaliterrae]MBB1254576.1 ABC-F family ATP-binding cassette domain-containing protein [Streptomyces alkaliterrae]MBB1259428.1 ABC-F family ATP-binding cassette domain-containing protein [Streptomyces alkaliterrae]MQS02925.1 ATP-binding cassette domain-containing protein [Streptomyces alkaliterrae]